MIRITIASIATAALMTGCGHHVVYNQIVTSDTRSLVGQQPHLQQQIQQETPSKNRQLPPYNIYHHSTGKKISTDQLTTTIPTPTKQPPQLTLVPISMLNKQGYVSSSQHQGGNVHLVRIPMLVMPRQQMPVNAPTQTITQKIADASQEEHQE